MTEWVTDNVSEVHNLSISKNAGSIFLRNDGNREMPASCWFLAWLIRSWRWRQHVLPKRRLTFSRLHGVVSQKIALKNYSFVYSLIFTFLVLTLIDRYVLWIQDFFIVILSGVRLSPLGSAATTGLLYQPQMIDDGDCGAIGWMKIGKGNQSTRRKPAPVPLCPPQMPHDLTRARNRAAAVRSQRLTAWAMARPYRLC
jgi:hypothetical protein